MPKFEKISYLPKVEAIKVKWTSGREQIIPSDTWIISHPDGSTTFASDEWFNQNYRSIEWVRDSHAEVL